MQLIRNKVTHTAVYLLPDDLPITLDAAGMTAGYLCALDITPATHEVLTDVPAPAVFVGGALTWDVTWTVTDQAAIDAEIDRQKPPVPKEVTMRQARLALNATGLLDTVTAAVAAAPKAVQIEWEFASDLKRHGPTLRALQTPLGLSDAQIDDLFTLAATL